MFFLTEKQEVDLHYGYGVRHVQAFLMFISLTVGYMARAHLGVTIVAMTDMRDSSHPVYEEISVAANGTTENMTVLLRNSTELMNCGGQCRNNFTNIIDSTNAAHGVSNFETVVYQKR